MCWITVDHSSQAHPSVRQHDHKHEFLLIDQSKSGNGRDLVITRQDVNEIQLAKGAIRAGIEVLLEWQEFQLDAIEGFYHCWCIRHLY